MALNPASRGINPVEYYRWPRVVEEIAEFLRGRWAALEGAGKQWARWLSGRPLRVDRPSDVPALVERLRGIGVRSFYGTIEVFRRLEESRDVEENYEANVLRATPFIDVDVVDEDRVGDAWRCVVEAAETIYNHLCGSYNLCRSIYMVWSGAGIHVRVNENAFSSELLEQHHPLDVAFAAAEYVLEQLEPQLLDLIRRCKGMIKIENLVAPKRVFTAPLSLHRRLDRVAVALAPEELGDFTPDWSRPENPRHNPQAWRRYERGEADEYARRALERIGRVRHRTLMEVRAARLLLPVPELPGGLSLPAAVASAPSSPREPGRFPVMALLQAARYYLLTGNLERAKSWGLNRAIFYAWAKYYGPARRPQLAARARRYSTRESTVGEDEIRWEEVGGERAQVSPRGWYVIGGVEQRPEDFDRNVARKFEEAGISFEEAWRAALEYLQRFPRSVLRDPQRFYKEVYEPVRDHFVEKVLKKMREKHGTLDRWLRRG